MHLAIHYCVCVKETMESHSLSVFLRVYAILLLSTLMLIADNLPAQQPDQEDGGDGHAVRTGGTGSL